MVKIKSLAEIEIMAKGGKILAGIMEELEKMTQPGIETQELNRVAETLILKSDSLPSFKDYQGFPATLCVSVNQEIVHGLPSERILKSGDVVSLDLGLIYQGYHSDMAVTLSLGKVSSEVKEMIRTTKEALFLGIKEVKAGSYLSQVSRVIQKHLEGKGLGVVRELCGHGIGRELHEEPQVLNALSSGKLAEFEKDLEIKEGMVLCLEPMATLGDWRIKKGRDGFAYETRDGSLAAHFEHTIAVLRDGNKILTMIK